MKSNAEYLKEFRPAIRFVLVFVLIYVIGNVIYGIWVESFKPMPDPATRWASEQSVVLINIFFDTVSTVVNENSPNILITRNQKVILSVFEGCNGVNVMIVFVSFIVAFGGRLKATIVYLLTGILVLHIANLIRLTLLYLTAIHQRPLFYYFHKYLFTAVLYAVVFLLWYIWIERLRRKLKTSDTVQA
ncbi:MAG TPA: exosortase family protein XrtF [Cyclobacteriaceae bacterium]|nr:exosortase family protein XrtF [Cyclobacteriaceae bacterium]